MPGPVADKTNIRRLYESHRLVPMLGDLFMEAAE